MLPEEIRKKKIDSLKDTLERSKELSRSWTQEYEENKQPSTKFPVTCINFMISLLEGWLEAETELLEIEASIRKAKPKSRSVKKRRKRKAVT